MTTTKEIREQQLDKMGIRRPTARRIVLIGCSKTKNPPPPPGKAKHGGQLPQVGPCDPSVLIWFCAAWLLAFVLYMAYDAWKEG